MAFERIKATFDHLFRKQDKSEEEQKFYVLIRAVYYLLSCIDAFEVGTRDFKATHDLAILIANLETTLGFTNEFKDFIRKKK